MHRIDCAPVLGVRIVVALSAVLASAPGCTTPLDIVDSGPDTPRLDAPATDAPRVDGGTDGGARDGGELDGGMTDGGTLDGGVTDGGALDEGAADVPTCTIIDLGDAEGAVASGSTVGSPTLMPACADATAPAVGYRWQAPRAGTFILHTRGSYDTILDLRDGSCAGTSLDCDDDGAEGYWSRLVIRAAEGEAFTILVTGWDGQSGDYEMFIVEGPQDETGLCDNGSDDDRDGDTDCADSDCRVLPRCIERACADTRDDDGDGRTDCADLDCDTDPSCPAEDCTNMMDDDMDGRIDCSDGFCFSHPDC